MSKKRISLIALFIGLIIVVIIYIIPCIKPLEIKGYFVPYKYVVYSNHVEIEEYIGEEENVIVPQWLYGHKVTIINPYAFTDNKKIKTIIIPDSIEEIKNCAFWGCENLQEITLPSKLKIISDNVFSGCSAIKEIKLPDSIESIEQHAFAYCHSLSEISIPSSTRKIRSRAFYKCTSLQDVSIPKKVSIIDEGAFEETPWLASQKTEFVTAGENVLVKYNGIDADINIPMGVTYIGKYFFHCNNNITKIECPTSVESIGMGCFWDCKNLEYIIFNNPDTYLDEMAIMDCPKLTIVSSKNSTSHKYAEENGIPWMELEE